MTIMNGGIPAAIGACATVALCGLIITVAVNLLLMLWNLLRDAPTSCSAAEPPPARPTETDPGRPRDRAPAPSGSRRHARQPAPAGPPSSPTATCSPSSASSATPPWPPPSATPPRRTAPCAAPSTPPGRWTPGRMSPPPPLWTRAAPEGHNGGDPPGRNGWVPETGGSEPPAEGIHKDTDGPDQASDSVDNRAHLPGRSHALMDLDVTALRLGHGPHLLPGYLTPRQATA